MSFSDGLTRNLFKIDDAGRTLYFPFGGLGRGYVLPDAETARRIRARVVRAAVALIVAAFALAGLSLGAWEIPALLLLLGLAELYAWSLARPFPPADLRIGLDEKVGLAARRHGPALMWAFFLTGLALTALFAAAAFGLVDDMAARFVAAGLALFSGGCAAVFGRMLLIARRG